MNKLGGKLYSVLGAYTGRESRLGAQTAIRVPLSWCFIPSLHAILVQNWTFHVGAGPHGSSPVLCFYSHGGLQTSGLQISPASPLIVLVGHPDSPMSKRSLASNTTSSTWRVHDAVLCLLNASAITASCRPRLLLESLVLPLQD